MATKKTTTKSTGKPKGAQPDNANAAQHSIYSRHYTSDELDRIISALTDPATPVTAAIEATAVMLDRIIARLSSQTSTDDAEATAAFIELAHLHNETTGRIAALTRSRAILSGDAADTLAGHVSALLDDISEVFHTQL